MKKKKTSAQVRYLGKVSSTDRPHDTCSSGVVRIITMYRWKIMCIHFAELSVNKACVRYLRKHFPVYPPTGTVFATPNRAQKPLFNPSLRISLQTHPHRTKCPYNFLVSYEAEHRTSVVRHFILNNLKPETRPWFKKLQSKRTYKASLAFRCSV